MTDEQFAVLQTVHVLLWVLVGVAGVVFVGGTVFLTARWYLDRRMGREALGMAALLVQMVEVLKLVRGWAESARTNAVESMHATKEMTKKLEHPSETIRKVEQILPEKVAAKVIERLSGDSGTFTPPRAGG